MATQSDEKVEALVAEQAIIAAAEAVRAEQYAKAKAEAKARMLTLLDRGVTNDRLLVPLPSDTYGEWVPNNPSDVARFESMGFKIDDTYAKSHAIHGSNRVADIIFMTCPMYVKEAINEIRAERFEKLHGKPDVKTKRELKEERDFRGKSDLPVVNSSVQETVDGDAIRQALGQQST